MTITPDIRTPHQVGRKARLELVFGRRNGRTVLAHGYAEPPLRVGRCFDEAHGVHLIMASSAPGLFGGDEYEQTVVLEAGAVVRLTSQSALQIHPSASGEVARVSNRYDIAEGADLTCVWDPLIPFANADLVQRLAVDVADGGRLSWSDGLMSGRQGRGERWQFTALDHELRVRRAAALDFLERYRIVPREEGPHQEWRVDAAGYVGTLLRAGHGDTHLIAEALHTALASVDAVRASADLLDSGLLLVRIVAEDGVAFRRARGAIDRIFTR